MDSLKLKTVFHCKSIRTVQQEIVGPEDI